jgi:hypothetical protein
VTLAVTGNNITCQRFSTLQNVGVSEASVAVDGQSMSYTVGKFQWKDV